MSSNELVPRVGADNPFGARETKPTAPRVVSLRLPSAVQTALAQSAADARMSVSSGLNWLVQNSFSNCQLLLPLTDCPDFLDAKLDVRIPPGTFEQLKSLLMA
jgi:hypothetical protein